MSVDTPLLVVGAGPHALTLLTYLRRYGMCRLCFRELAHKGEIPGVVKASW